MYRTSVYTKIGQYDPQFRFEDTDFWLRLTKAFEVGFIDEKLSYYRIHRDNLSGSDNLLKFYNDEIVKIYQKNVDDPVLLKQASMRIYRKSFLRALRSGKIRHFVKYLYRYWSVKYFGKQSHSIGVFSLILL